ncbi:rhodanese-like domain-containing protein [Neisseria gonorrhoeae]|uniref:rhodanese-like domain-containing protein n=1 Tax=Neisseria gonorrhoeae TaxID=485 RepID=UPI00280442F0|nr:rhodanese-like domain-containing protein [Neisseria gonorrhoeae]
MNIKQLITAALIASAAFATQAAPQKPVSAAQTAQHSAVWIDVRSEQEFSEGHLHNAVNIPVDQIVRRIYEAAPDKDTPVNLYCRSGRRAEAALQELKKAGYTNVANHGSYEDLLKKGMK